MGAKETKARALEVLNELFYLVAPEERGKVELATHYIEDIRGVTEYG